MNVKGRKALGLAICAVLVAGAFTQAAGANRLSLSAQSFAEVISRMRFQGQSGEMPIVCAVTLSGTYHARTITKTRGTLVGYINRAAASGCTGEGEVRFDATSLPAHVRYDSFTGTLPNFTGVSFRSSNQRITNTYIFGALVCTYAAGAGDDVQYRYEREAGGALVQTAWIWRIPGIASNSIFCPSLLTSEGTSSTRTAEGGTLRGSLI